MKRAIRLRIYDPVGNLIREDHVPEGQSLDIRGERPTSLVVGRVTLDPSPAHSSVPDNRHYGAPLHDRIQNLFNRGRDQLVMIYRAALMGDPDGNTTWDLATAIAHRELHIALGWVPQEGDHSFVESKDPVFGQAYCWYPVKPGVYCGRGREHHGAGTCEGETVGICSGGPAHHPDCSSARSAVDPWAQHGPGWCPPEVHTGHLPGVVCPPGCTARKGEEATNVQWLADKQRATVDPLLAWLARGQAAQKAADEIIAAHSADSVAPKLSPEEAAQIQKMLDARRNVGQLGPECGETDGVMADWVTPMAVCSRSPGHWEAIHREVRNGGYVWAEWRQVLPGSAWEAARAKRFPSRFGKQARA